MVFVETSDFVNSSDNPSLGSIVHRTLAVVLGFSDLVLLGNVPLIVERVQQVVASVPELVDCGNRHV